MQVATGLLAASAVLHTTGTRTQPFSTAGSSTSSSSGGGGGGRTLCAIATNEESRSTGQPCHFDYFGTTALSDDGGWFTATCAEDQVGVHLSICPSERGLCCLVHLRAGYTSSPVTVRTCTAQAALCCLAPSCVRMTRPYYGPRLTWTPCAR